MVNQQTLDEMTRRLVAEFDPEQIILFGSHAWGTPDSSSDVDLMVIVSTSDAPPAKRMIRAHACLADLGAPKDIVVKTRREFELLRPAMASLEHKVATQGRVLYDRSQEAVGA